MATELGGIVWSIGKKGVLIGSVNNVAVVTIAGLANLSTDTDGKVYVKTGESQTEIDNDDVKVEYEEDGDAYKGTVTLGQTVLAMAPKAAVSLTNGKIDGKNFAGVLDVSSRAVAIANKEGAEESSEHLVYTAKNGTAAIVANLTEGYNLAANGLSASYSAAGEVTLATISGLRKGLADGSANLEKMILSDTAKTDGTGIVTLTKDTEGDDDMFTTSNITIAKNTKNAFANSLSYSLALGETTAGDYAQKAQDNYWEIAKAGTATYKFETPEGYVYNNAEATAATGDTQINYQKAFTTVIATVTGLNADAEVSSDKTSVGISTSAPDATTGEQEYTYTSGLTISNVGIPTKLNAKGVATNKGDFTVTVKDNVLPNTKGTLKVTPGTNYQVKADGGFVTDSADNDAVKISGTADHSAFETNGLYQNIWVINGNTAVYKKVRLGYYNTSVANQMTYVPQADAVTFLTITGLSSEALATNANYKTVKGSKVITSITGLNWTTAPDADHSTDKGKDVWTKKTEAGVLTIADPTSPEAEYSLFDKRNITIGKSDNVKLVIDAGLAPKFSDQKWNLSGTSATLKGTIEGGYTSSDDGKTIIYTADTQNATLATISGLKKGTVLTSGASDSRTIGYGSGDSFKQGIEDSTSVLSYADTADATTGTKKLNKLDIEISANVLDTSKVALKSTFYKLKLDDGTDKGGAVVTKGDEEGSTNKYFTVSGTTATYKQAKSRPYYTMDDAGTSITYIKEESPVTLATIKGISADTNINIYDTEGDGSATVVASAQNTDNDIYIDNSTGVITIKEGALNGTAITVTKATKGIPDDEKNKTYTFALDSNVATSNLKWTQTGNTVYLKADSGYAVSANGQTINYTKEGGQQTIIAQITGLQAELFAEGYENGTTAFTTGTTNVNPDVTAKGIKLDNTAGAGSITLSLNALNNANVALTGAGGYKLEVDASEDVDKKVPIKATPNQNTWVVNGTTAIFKAVNTSYYAYDVNKNTLTYKKAADIKDATVYATITGIKDGLLVNPSDATKLGHYVTETNESTGETTTTFENVIEITGTTSENPAPVIKIVDSYALAGKDIVLNAKGSLADATIKVEVPDDDTEFKDLMTAGLVNGATASWTVNNKGVTNYNYTGSVKEYYSNEDNKIAYHPADSSAVIATITGLKTGLTDSELEGLKPSTESDKENEITLKGSLLAGKDVALTTKIQLEDDPYVFVIDNTDSVTQYDDLVDISSEDPEPEEGKTKHAGWSIVDNKKTGATATYGEYTDEYYEVDDEDSITALTYKAAGFNKEFAKLSGTGLKNGLVTIQNDQLSEIAPTTVSGTTTFTMTGDAISVGGNVTLEAGADAGENTYKMEIGSGIDKPEGDYTCVLNNKSVDIFETTTDGYTLTEDGTSLEYNAEVKKTSGDGFTKYGQVSGLKEGFVIGSDGKIEGLDVDATNKTITVAKELLPVSTTEENVVTLDNPATGFVLAIGDGAPEVSNDGSGYTLSGDGVLTVYTGCAVGGYKLADSSKAIKYTPGGKQNANVAVKIKGLNISALENDKFVNEIDGIKIEDKTITLSANVLGTGTVTFDENTNNSYSFELATEVPLTDQSATWAFDKNKGTATYTEKVNAGYALDKNTNTITYTPTKTVTSTLTNLNKNEGKIEVSEDGKSLISGTKGENDQDVNVITFEDGKFKLAEDALANKTVILTTKSSVKGYDPGYKVAFADDNIAANKLDYVLTKNSGDTKATLTQTTESGYSLSSDGKQIVYSSDPTTVTLATISGLNKDAVSEDNEAQVAANVDFATKIDGIEITEPSGDNPGTITISKNSVLTTGNVTLGKGDNYKLAISGSEIKTEAGQATPTFVADKKGVHYKNVTPAYYETSDDGKTITYKAPGDGETLFTITGLNANAVPDASGEIEGVEVGQDKVVKLSSNVLSTTAIKITGDGYTLALDSTDNSIVSAKPTVDTTEWVAEGSNYIYRTYTKGYYTAVEDGTNGVKSITYTAPVIDKNNNFVTISGLKAGIVETLNTQAKADGNDFLTTSGTITLDNTMLDGKNVTLTTKGSHKLKLDTTNADTDKKVTASEISDTEWSTTNTTATLKGTISEGYLLNEAGTGVTYYNADKSGQTIATISNLASNAKIEANDVETDSTTGYTTVTLKKSQLGTKNVTIKGDFFKLDAATDSKSLTDAAKWVKAANKTVATYTQTTYKGFSPSADGKTLTYLAKTTDVNLATVNGVSKTLTTDDMAAGTENSDNKAIFLNTSDNTITINDKSALNPGNVTLGKNDAYTLKAGTGLAATNVSDHLTFNKGTASIVKGTSAGWEETNDKLLTYTKPVETTVSTIKGLSKNLEYNSDDSSLESVDLDTTNYKITLGKTAVEAVTAKNSIVLTNNSDTEYELAFNSTDPNESLASYTGNTDDERWDLSGTTLTITGVKSEGYNLEDDNKKVTYTAASDDAVKAKITGLPNKLLKKSADGSIVLSNGDLAIKKATPGNDILLTGEFKSAVSNTDLELKLDSSTYSFDPQGLTGNTTDSGKQMLTENVSLNGSATIYEKITQKWAVADSNKTITHTAGKNTTYVTINGLNKSGENGIEYTNGTTNVTLNSSALTASNVTMARGKNSGNDDFRLVLGSEVNSTKNADTKDKWKDQTEWVTSGGTATYKLYDKANWYESDVNTKINLNSIIYVAPTKGTQFAVISGMAKDATLGASIGATGEGDNKGTITLGKDQLEGITKAVTLKVTTAKKVSAGKNITEEQATLTNGFIDTGNTTAENFKLALDSTIKENLSGAADAVWDTNGTKAILTGTTTKGYKLSDDQKTITYQAADLKGQTIATVTGLKVGSEIAATDVGKTETLASGALSTTVSLTPDHLGTSSVVISGAGYKLALTDEVLTSADSVAGGENSWNDQTGWVANKGTFVYKTYDKAYWNLNEAETTAVYHAAVDEKAKTNPDTVHQTYVTIKGLKADITGDTTLIGGITDSMSGEGVKDGAQSIGSDLTSRVITLNDDVLNKTTVTLADSSGFGYALGLDSNVDSSTVDETAAAVSTAKGITTVTWTGTKGIGYHVANDGQSIEYYSAPRAKQTIAQVTGFKSTTTKEDVVADYDGTDNVVTLSGDSLTSAVGISGTAEFSFNESFKDGTITGSKLADKVSIAGSGVTVNTGKGNDYVDLGTSGNTFFYANGDGNDVIANFTAGTDTIKITNLAQEVTDKKGNKSTLIAVEANGGDAVVKVNNVNAIRLNGLASSVDALKASIYDKNGDTLSATAAEIGNVLADDNFATTPQLSSIVKASASTYSTEDLVATDATSLTKQSSAIAYSGSSKK